MKELHDIIASAIDYLDEEYSVEAADCFPLKKSGTLRQSFVNAEDLVEMKIKSKKSGVIAKIVAVAAAFVCVVAAAIFFIANSNFISVLSPAGFVPDFTGERGSLSELGSYASIKDDFIYYEGTDGFYEYDYTTKESVKVSENSLGCNAVSCGFIVYEDGKIIYRNFKGESLYEQTAENMVGIYPKYLFAYDNIIYFGDFMLNAKTGETIRIFEDSEIQRGFYYALSNEYYFRANVDDNVIERVRLSDNEHDTLELPKEITFISGFAADLNSDLYIATPENAKFTIYKIGADGSFENTEAYGVLYTAINSKIFYLENTQSGQTSYPLMLKTDGKTEKIADNVFDFRVLSERFVIYRTYGSTDGKDGLFVYDRNEKATTELKTLTEE